MKTIVEIDIQQNWMYVYSSYDKILIDHIKSYPSTLRSWDNDSKEWEIHISLFDDLVNFLADNNIEHKMFGDISDAEILEDVDFKVEPLPWQTEAVIYGMKHDKWLLADTMGLRQDGFQS